MFLNKPNYPVSDNDGNEVWISRSVVVIGLIYHGEDVLIVQRGEDVSFTGNWCMPCGYLDWNETIHQALIREIWEETNLDLRQIDHKIHGTNIISCPNNRKQDISFHHIIEVTSVEKPIFDISKIDKGEVIDIKWENWNNIPKYTFAFNHDFRILEHFTK